jgi:hypothetical protein
MEKIVLTRVYMHHCCANPTAVPAACTSCIDINWVEAAENAVETAKR